MSEEKSKGQCKKWYDVYVRKGTGQESGVSMAEAAFIIVRMQLRIA
jgi:hypothetical protein